MFIDSEATARAWLTSWRAQGGPRRGILIATIAGLEMALAIMVTASARYSEAERDGTRAALDILWNHPNGSPSTNAAI